MDEKMTWDQVFELIKRIDQLEIQAKKLNARLTALENIEQSIKGDDFMDRFYS